MKRVGFFSRYYAIAGRTRGVETESGERKRCAARDTCNECRRVRNSEPLAQKLSIPSISHGSRFSRFTQRVDRHGATSKGSRMAFRLELSAPFDHFKSYAVLP